MTNTDQATSSSLAIYFLKQAHTASQNDGSKYETGRRPKGFL